ncbi:MAG TPA: NfeD family protein [Albitalea sp.]|uniref:NfeD family protein n=1 Tax=Piscinibacter sp. TaxID=1903157 RepID=UPI002ED4A0C4
MDVSASTFWWVAAGIAVAAELTTGTFYLLMVALGLAAAAIAAHLGLATGLQLVTAAIVGGGATALWHWTHARHPVSLPSERNRDVNLDVGERIEVAAWGADRTTRVQYRGSTWTARLQADAPAAPGAHRVVAVEGNWLVLAPAPSH